jgi:NAD(P)-dependent dehydrogenase (short-subunit alcohol dehydrogenase family)
VLIGTPWSTGQERRDWDADRQPAVHDRPAAIFGVPPAGFRDVLETKVTGTFLVIKAVVSRMLSAGGGREVTISRSAQTMTRRGFIPYGPSAPPWRPWPG